MNHTVGFTYVLSRFFIEIWDSDSDSKFAVRIFDRKLYMMYGISFLQ